MQEMIDPQHPGIARLSDGAGQDRGFAADVLGGLLAPDPQRIEHRGDAAGRELAIIGDYCRERIPEHFRARHVMGLDMIGVQLDQPRNDKIAGHILPRRRRRALAEFRDLSLRHRDPAGREHAVRQHQARVGKNERVSVGHHGSGRLCKGGDVDDMVGNRVANVLVVDDRHDGGAAPLLLGDELDHGGAVFGIE